MRWVYARRGHAGADHRQSPNSEWVRTPVAARSEPRRAPAVHISIGDYRRYCHHQCGSRWGTVVWGYASGAWGGRASHGTTAHVEHGRAVQSADSLRPRPDSAHHHDTSPTLATVALLQARCFSVYSFRGMTEQTDAERRSVLDEDEATEAMPVIVCCVVRGCFTSSLYSAAGRHGHTIPLASFGCGLCVSSWATSAF